MYLKEIRIKNFRSIVNSTIKFTRSNIFVGKNDVGKSNILKALNLFFNGDTELGTPFDFETDFTKLFPEKSHAAKEVRIAVVIEVPDNTFSDGGDIIWEKIWRKDGFVLDKEKIYKQKGFSELSRRSRIPSALRRIKYRYVPAVKSPAFFKELLGTLYDTISISLSDSLGEPIESFSNVLQGATVSMSKNLKESLGIDSIINFPTDLRELFTTLKFDTHSDAGINYSLDFRGDGIKARHIPMVLKYIAEEDMKTRNSGSTRVTTIWGYEEPENSLELSNCFSVADELHKFSNEIQMFITTHSPAFYLSYQKENVSLFHVDQKKYDEDTSILLIKNVDEIDKDLGLLHLVSPYIDYVKNEYELDINSLKQNLENFRKKNNELQNLINNTGMIDAPTIFVEGKTDKQYLLKAFELFNSTLSQNVQDGKIRIIVDEDYGGVNQLKNWVEAWCRTTYKSKMLTLLDEDEAASTRKSDLQKDECVKYMERNKQIKLCSLPKPKQIIELHKKGIHMEFAIEHLFPLSVWMNNSSCLTDKSSDNFPVLENYDGELGIKPAIRDIVGDNTFSDFFIFKKVKKDRKQSFCDKTFNYYEIDMTIFDEFKKLVDIISEFFDISFNYEEAVT